MSRGKRKKVKENPDIRHSLEVDTEGRTLTKEQKEFFKDSKVVDEKGNLLAVYHGTPEGGFYIFDSAQSYIADSPSVANWFTANREIVEKYYSVENSMAPNQKEVYG